jgi:hypothetical protein
MTSILDRYFSKEKIEITTNGCWIWQMAKNQKGYGLVKHKGKMRLVHRLVLEEKLKTPIKSYACHLCHNPSCVNPEHLYDGTQSENMNDMYNSKRETKIGSKNGYSKLNETQVKKIKERLNNNETLLSISTDYQVSFKTIWNIKANLTWRHV